MNYPTDLLDVFLHTFGLTNAGPLELEFIAENCRREADSVPGGPMAAETLAAALRGRARTLRADPLIGTASGDRAKALADLM